MITKAQLDAALSDLEKRIGRGTDFKVDARIFTLEESLKKRMEELDGKRELAEDESFAEMEKTLAEVKSICQAHAEEIGELKERLCELERFIADTAKEEKKVSMEDAFDDEIRDDFS